MLHSVTLYSLVLKDTVTVTQNTHVQKHSSESYFLTMQGPDCSVAFCVLQPPLALASHSSSC